MTQPGSPLERFALASWLVLVMTMLLTMARIPMVSWDARAIWGHHARLIHDAGRWPAPEVWDLGYPLPHNQYPPLLPLLQAAAYGLVPDERVLRVVPFLAYPVIVGLLLLELPRRDPRRGRLLASSYALLPTLVLSEQGGADAGVADTVLAGWVLGAALALDAGRPALGGALAAAAGLTKNEGLVLGALLVFSAGLRCGQRRRSLRPLLSAGGAFLAGVLPWLALRARIRPGLDENYLSRLNAEQLASGLERAPAVAVEMARIAFLNPSRTGLFFWLVLLLFASSRRRRESWIERRLLVLPAYLAVVFVVYVISPWPGLTQVQLSFERLLLPVAPLALLALAEPSALTPPVDPRVPARP